MEGYPDRMDVIMAEAMPLTISQNSELQKAIIIDPTKK
jgi:hypothetical protein